MTELSRPCNDADLGPIVASSCRAGFDFTLLFEQLFFSLIIAVVSGIAFAIRLVQLRNAAKLLPRRRDIHLMGKLFASVTLVVCNAVLVAYWALHPDTLASIPSAVVELVASLLLCALSYRAHCSTIRPSFCLGFALLASIAGQAILTRTLWLIPGARMPAIITSVGLMLRCCLLALESQIKSLPDPLSSLPRETLVGPISRAFLWWVNEILARGWRTRLSLDHLFELDAHLDSRVLQHKLAKRRGAGEGLLRAVCLSLRWPMVATIIPRVLLCVFNVSQPLLIETATKYLGSSGNSRDNNTAYGLIGVTAIIYIGIAISTAAYKANLVRTIAMMRGALVASIYGKTLELPKDIVSKRAAATLMSTDIERIAFGMLNAHEAWASPVEVIVAIYLLQRQIGYITIVPVVVAIVCSALVYWIAIRVRKNQREWNEAVERRIGETSIIISKIEGVKAAGLTKNMRDRIQSLRVAELEACKSYRRLQVGKNVLSNTSALLSPFLTFVALIYSSSTRRLDGPTAFTTLAIIHILTTPLQVALNALPVLVGAFGCFDRIQSYLDQTVYNASNWSSQDLLYKPWKKGEDFELTNVNVELDGKTILRDFTHCFPAGSVSLVVGPSGIGKSTLLQVMLGELALKSGAISTRPLTVAYCSQEPWLQNKSIRDTIVSDGTWDPEWYREVIHACCLDGDLKMMSEGDMSGVVSGGSSLSEGQRKKLVLARAVYCRAPLVLLDDSFNGIDHDAQHTIALRLLGPEGLLRRMHCTTVLTASTAVFDDFVDRVVTLPSDGSIMTHMRQAPARVVSPCEAVVPNLTPGYEIHEGEALTPIPLDSSLVPTRAQPQPVIISLPKEVHQEEGSLADVERAVPTPSNLSDDDGGRSVSDWEVYVYYLRTMGFGLIGLFFSVLVIEIFLEKFPQAWLKLWVTSETQSPGEHTVMYLVVYGVLAVLGLAVLGGVIWLWFVVMLPKSANELHRILLNAVLRAPAWFLSGAGMGNVINRFSQDMELVDMDLPLAFYHTAFSALFCLASLILITTSGQYVAIIIPFSLVFVFSLQKFYLRTSRQLRLLDLETKAPLYEHFLEPAQGVSTIRAFGWSDNHLSRLLGVLDTSQRPYYLLFMIQRWLNLVLDLFVAALAVIVITMAVLIPSGSSSASLGLAMINLLSFNTGLAELIDAWTVLETSLGAVARLISFEKSTPVERLGTNVNDICVPQDWPCRGLIEIKDLTCSYGPAGAPVLKSIDLTIQPGEVLGIDGASGSGKSTLLKSIIGLATIQSGSIIIDTLPVANVEPETVRSRIITVQQEPFYPPNATLRSAMMWPPPSTPHIPTSECDADGRPRQQHMTPALAAAAAAADEAILSVLEDVEILANLSGRAARVHPDNAHPVSADASAASLSCPLVDLNLSQRERQLLSMARACLQAEHMGAKVVLFDEPIAGGESSGDLERVFARIVKEKLKGCTVIVVSHRVATLGVANRLVRLDQGRLLDVSASTETVLAET